MHLSILATVSGLKSAVFLSALVSWFRWLSVVEDKAKHHSIKDNPCVTVQNIAKKDQLNQLKWM